MNRHLRAALPGAVAFAASLAVLSSVVYFSPPLLPSWPRGLFEAARVAFPASLVIGAMVFLSSCLSVYTPPLDKRGPRDPDGS